MTCFTQQHTYYQAVFSHQSQVAQINRLELHFLLFKVSQSIVIDPTHLLIHQFIQFFACRFCFSQCHQEKYVVLDMRKQLLTYLYLKNLNFFSVYTLKKMWYSIIRYWLKYVKLLTIKSLQKKMSISVTSFIG